MNGRSSTSVSSLFMQQGVVIVRVLYEPWWLRRQWLCDFTTPQRQTALSAFSLQETHPARSRAAQPLSPPLPLLCSSRTLQPCTRLLIRGRRRSVTNESPNDCWWSRSPPPPPPLPPIVTTQQASIEYIFFFFFFFKSTVFISGETWVFEIEIEILNLFYSPYSQITIGLIAI